jgi:hypothetical protein
MGDGFEIPCGEVGWYASQFYPTPLPPEEKTVTPRHFA